MPVQCVSEGDRNVVVYSGEGFVLKLMPSMQRQVCAEIMNEVVPKQIS